MPFRLPLPAQCTGNAGEDTLGLKARVEDLFYDQQFDVNTVRTIETGARHLYLFDCYYHFRVGQSAKGRFGTACLIQSDAFKRVRSPVLLCERIWTDAWLLSDQVDMGDSPFARAFIVQSKDSVGAKETLNGSVQAILFEHLNATNFNPVEVAIGPGGAVSLTGLTAEHERWHDLLDLARRIEAAMQ